MLVWDCKLKLTIATFFFSKDEMEVDISKEESYLCYSTEYCHCWKGGPSTGIQGIGTKIF